MGDSVQQIKDKLSIVDVVGRYVKLERAGVNFRARCPFHSERTPSFFISPDRGTYHCFGCSVGGDIFTFIEEIEGTDFKGALKMLAQQAGVELVPEKKEVRDERSRAYAIIEEATLFYQKGLTEKHPAYTYLTERGLSPATISSFRLGWAPKEWRALAGYLRARGYREEEMEQVGVVKSTERGVYDRFRERIIFPIADIAGRTVGFSGRIFSEDAKDAPKYINSPETPLFHKSYILYGYDRAKQAIRTNRCAVLVEGQMDLLMVHEVGWTNAVAVSGTALTEHHVLLLKRMSDNLVLALDADSAGFSAALKSARIALLGGMEVRVAALPSGSDPAEFIQKDGKEAWGKIMRESKRIISFLLDAHAAGSKSESHFHDLVRKDVLPFVAGIQSYTKRESAVHEVSGKTGWSEQAVYRELERLPQEDISMIAEAGETAPTEKKITGGYDARIRQLWGVILWQRAKENPDINVEELLGGLRSAIGSGAAELEQIPESEKESLLFAAETLYADAEHLNDDIQALARIVSLDSLKRRLADASARLRRAEASGDEKMRHVALEECQKLTGEIAHFDKMR